MKIDRIVHRVMDFEYSILFFFCQALSAALLELNRKYGLRTSGLQFLFWFFLLICGIPQLRRQINERHTRLADGIENSYDEYHFTSYFIFYITSLAIWILNCYADREPLQTKYPKSQARFNRNNIFVTATLNLIFFTFLVNFLETISRIGCQLFVTSVFRMVRSAGLERVSKTIGTRRSMGYEPRRFVKRDNARIYETLGKIRSQSGWQ